MSYLRDPAPPPGARIVAFAGARLVAADDDCQQGGDWLVRPVEAARAYPGAVPCHQAHRIALEGGRSLPYAEWRWSLRAPGRGPSVFPGGGGDGGALRASPGVSLGRCAFRRSG